MRFGKIVRVAFLAPALVMAALASVSPALSGGEGGSGRAPEITLKDLYGKDVAIAYAGHAATLVNFWAVWCIPCHDEMPQIADLVDANRDRGFRAVGIVVESGDAAKVRSFLAETPELGVNYPIVMGDESVLAKFGGVEVIPTTFLVDSGGNIFRTYLGVNPGFREEVGADIAALLKSAAPDVPKAAPEGSRKD